MGLDGGTIPSRADILRRSSWRLANTSTSRSSRGGNVDNLPSGEPGQGTKQEQGRLKWSICSLTAEPLRAPIVVCELGKLYNRSSVIEFLLGEGVFVYRREELKKNGFGHLISIKNVTELKLTENPSYDPNKATSNMDTTAKAPGKFVCPVTQLETNGMHQFCAIKGCGHVFSEKALTLFQELVACWTCNTPYTKDDVIPINPTDKVAEELEKKVKERLEEQQEKKDKKRKKREEKKKAAESNKRLAIEAAKASSSKSSKSSSSKSSSSSALTTTTTTTTTTEDTTKEVEDDPSLGPMLGPFMPPSR